MRNRLLTFAGVLAILAVIGKFYAVPLYAQVKAALVQDRDSQGRNAYYNLLSNANSQGGACHNTCWVDFPAVPTGKRLIVQQVSVFAQYTSAGAPAPAAIELRAVTANVNISESVPFSPVLNNYGAETWYFARMPVHTYYDAGQTPRVVTYSPSGAAYNMTTSISGYMIDVP